MKYTDIKSIPKYQFKRLIGIKPSTSHQVIDVLNLAQPYNDEQLIVTTQVETPLYEHVKIKWTIRYLSLKDWNVNRITPS